MANLYKSTQFMQLSFVITLADILLYSNQDSSRYWHVLVRALGVCDDVKWTLNYNQPNKKWNAQYAHRQMRWCTCT